MLIKLNGWDEVNAMDKLPAGGYVCSIGEVKTEEIYGKLQLRVEIDIAEGEYANYFQRKFDADKQRNDSAHWSYNAVFRRYVFDANDKVTRAFKSFVTAVADSNDGFTFDPDRFDEKALEGKLCGFTFGEREYEYNGQTYSSAEVRFPIAADKIRSGKFDVPEPQPLKKSEPDYESVPF